VSQHAPETTEANARLIAAAPDLLKACEVMLADLLEMENIVGVRASVVIGRAAIAKAKGGTS
jgi:hypothetical protein